MDINIQRRKATFVFVTMRYDLFCTYLCGMNFNGDDRNQTKKRQKQTNRRKKSAVVIAC